MRYRVTHTAVAAIALFAPAVCAADDADDKATKAALAFVDAAARGDYGQARTMFADVMKQAVTQQQLAERIGTRQSVIARLEDADYSGHSLTMLAKIAQALDRTVCVELTPIAGAKKRKSAKAKPGRKKAS